MSHTLTLRIDEQLEAKLEAAALRLKQPKTALAREAVAKWLDRVLPRRADVLLAAAGAARGWGKSATNANIRKAMRRRRK